jgi:MFS family permease
MSTANGLGYLLGALVTAAVVRRWGTTVAFRAGMAGTAVSLAATAATDDYLALLAVRASAGVAGAVVFIAGGVIASRVAARVASAAPITVYFAGTGLGIVFSGVMQSVCPPGRACHRTANRRPRVVGAVGPADERRSAGQASSAVPNDTATSSHSAAGRLLR